MPTNGSHVFVDDSIGRKLKAATAFADDAIDAVLEFESAPAQEDMRNNAPWQDRTGNARQGLNARAYKSGDEHGMVLYHTMPYGLFLETKHSGKFRIIMPAVLRTGRRVMQSLRGYFRLLP